VAAYADDVDVLVIGFGACSTVSGDVDVAFGYEYVAWWHVMVFEGDLACCISGAFKYEQIDSQCTFSPALRIPSYSFVALADVWPVVFLEDFAGGGEVAPGCGFGLLFFCDGRFGLEDEAFLCLSASV
jgi:hypothetical protein